MPDIVGKLLNRFDLHAQELFRGATIAIAIRIFAALLGFTLNVVLARILGADQVGLYFICLTLVVIMSTVGALGMGNALLKLVAAYSGSGNLDKSAGLYLKAIKYVFIATLCLSTLLYFLSPILSHRVYAKPELEDYLAIMCIAIAPLTLLSLHVQALRGLQKNVASFCVQLIYVPLFMCFGTLLFSPHYGLKAVLWTYVLSNSVVLLIGVWHWRRAVPTNGRVLNVSDRRELLASSIPSHFVAVFKILILWSPIFILGVWETNGNVGIFGVASRVAMLASFILVAVNSITAPKFALLHKRKEFGELRKLARLSTRILSLVAGVTVLVFIFFSKNIMTIFGEQFIEGAPILVLLAIGQFVSVALGSAEVLLMMSNKEQLVKNIYLFVCPFSIGSSLIFIPIYGITGAAIGVLCTIVVQCTLANVFASRALGYPVFSIGKR